MKRFSVILCTFLFLLPLIAEGKTPSQIAIILDDVGGKPTDSVLFDLPKQITFSILPNTQYSTAFSHRAAQQNREVMLHMPMEPLEEKSLGDGPLLANMYPKQMRQTLYAALKTVPHAVGVNNHMGSKLTQMSLPMQTVMTALADNNLFFIDSLTTRNSMASEMALISGVRHASRHIFLDHLQTEAFIQQQFTSLIELARKRGKAIAIGHPYPITIEFLQAAIADLPDDIEVITVSQYLNETNKFRINPMLVRSPKNITTDTKAPETAPK